MTSQEPANKRRKLSTSCFTTPGDSHYMMTRSSKRKKETENLRAAHIFLRDQINNVEEDEKHACAQLLHTQLIQRIHSILMKDLLGRNQTAAGRFSTEVRFSMQGQTFYYPTFKKEDIAIAAIEAWLDNYNDSVRIMKDRAESLTDETLTQIFRLVAKFVFTFLQLHLFADGNGRLGRLICSYILEIVCPFPSAIYNVYSPTKKKDYVNILVKARKGLEFKRDLNFKQEAIDFVGDILNHIDRMGSDLTALIVESNWYTWKEYLGNRN